VAERALWPAGLVYDEVPAQRRALDEQDHRPWPLPRHPWLMGQTWRELLFAHWAVEPEAVRRVVPPQLELDLRNGAAWVGVTPFRVTGLRGQGMAPIPGLSAFLEVNVRTYVVAGGRPGIYFFSLDASSAAAVAAARRGYRLPYFRAQMSAARDGAGIRYRSERVSSDGLAAALDLAYEPSGPPLPVEDESIERWLAERYCLYTLDERGRVLRGDIHHPPWPLRPASARIALNTMGRQVGLELSGEPLLHYSPRQDTLLWALDRA
jgi:uncharacterized protein YqjF (DUF2071 family)